MTKQGKQTIVAICQIHNEDVFIEQVINNILVFCDIILVADHRSTDNTELILTKLTSQNSKIHYFKIGHPRDAHEMIRQYACTPTWVFPVDGDELYDPLGLVKLKSQINSGQYDAYRQIYGHSMHCIAIDQVKKIAKGYLSPPSRTVTKLYNFGALIDWAGPCPERCHGGTIVFKKEFCEQSNLNLMETIQWDESPLRLLHACFLQRSSLEPEQRSVGRKNPYELQSMSRPTRWINQFSVWLGKQNISKYKEEKYMKGPLMEKDVSVFFGE